MSTVETAHYDVVTILKKVKEHIKSAKQGIIDVCHIYEAEGKTQKEKIAERVYDECRKLGYNEDEIDVVRKYVPSEFKDHTNDPQTEPRIDSTLENLNRSNINETLTDDRFEELLTSTNDAVPLLSKYKLTTEQRAKLSAAEKKEFWDNRLRLIAEHDEEIKRAKNDSKQDLITDGIKTTEEEFKESTIVPPENLWSKESLTYQINDRLGQYYLLMAKAHYDIRDHVEKFVPTAEIQAEHKEEFIKFRDKVIVPLANISAFIMKFSNTITDNVTDEKYGDTLLSWFKIAEDKFWTAGNHGSGEINAILTGKYIGKLKTNYTEEAEAEEQGTKKPKARYTVIETPVEREFTREQVGDKTKFMFSEIGTLHCVKEECRAENFFRVVPIEISDSVFGDMFNKAKTAIIGNPLSNQLETICDHVAIRKLRSPVDILLYHNPKATPEEIQKLQYIFGQPEKMKEVEIDSKTVMSLGYNIIYGRAGRRSNKAEHFGDVA